MINYMKYFALTYLIYSSFLFSGLFGPSSDEDYADELIKIIELGQNNQDPLKYCGKGSLFNTTTLRSYNGDYCKNPLFGGYAYHTCFARPIVAFEGSECHKNINKWAMIDETNKNIQHIQDGFYAALNNIPKNKLEKICTYFNKANPSLSNIKCPPPKEFIPSFRLTSTPIDKLPVMIKGNALVLSESTSCDLGFMDVNCQCCLTKHYHFYHESSAKTLSGCAKYCNSTSLATLRSRLELESKVSDDKLIKDIFEKTSLVNYGVVNISYLSSKGNIDDNKNEEGIKELLRTTKAFSGFDPSSLGLIKKLGGGGSYARDVYLIKYQNKNYILKFTQDPAAIFSDGFPGREINNLAIVRENKELQPLFAEHAASNSLRLIGMKSVLAYQDQNKKLHYGILMQAAHGKSMLTEMEEFAQNYGKNDWQKYALKIAAMIYSFGNRLAKFHLQLADHNSSGPIKETMQHRDLHGENVFVSYNSDLAQRIFTLTKDIANPGITQWVKVFNNFAQEFEFSLIDLDTLSLSIPGSNAKWLPGSSVFLGHKLNRKVLPEGDLIKPVMYHLCALVAEHRLWDKKAPMSALMTYLLTPFIMGYISAYPSSEQLAVAKKIGEIMMASFIVMNTNAVACNPLKLDEVQKDFIRPFFTEDNLRTILNYL